MNISNIRKIPSSFKLLVITALLAGFAVGCKSGEESVPIIKIEGLNPLTALFNPPLPAKPFLLTDHRGDSFTEKNLQKKWSFMFIGYTHCPDVCPSTLNKLVSIFSALEKVGDIENSSFVFLSVDPKRDNVETLAKYVSYFNDNFIGLTGKETDIKEFTRQVGMAYMVSEKTGEKAANEYKIDHSSSIMLFGPSGRQVARFSTNQESDSILSDFKKIRHRYEQY